MQRESEETCPRPRLFKRSRSNRQRILRCFSTTLHWGIIMAIKRFGLDAAITRGPQDRAEDTNATFPRAVRCKGRRALFASGQNSSFLLDSYKEDHIFSSAVPGNTNTVIFSSSWRARGRRCVVLKRRYCATHRFSLHCSEQEGRRCPPHGIGSKKSIAFPKKPSAAHRETQGARARNKPGIAAILLTAGAGDRTILPCTGSPPGEDLE